MATDLSPKLWELLNTLSVDSQSSVIAKCTELGFDLNKGEIPLQEAFSNLNFCANTLQDAVQKEKLIQFPITIQKEILTLVENISRLLASLNSGSDEVINIVNAIELLNAAVWRYRLHNISDRMLGYETKMNQLKQQDLAATELKQKLELGLEIKDQLQALLVEMRTAQDQITKASTSADTSAEQSTEKLQEITALWQTTTTKAQSASENESTLAQQLVKAKASIAEITTLEERITKFYEDVEASTAKVTSTAIDADKTVSSNKIQTEELIKNLKELEEQIKVQVEKATGFTLFHSFQTRQENIAAAKRRWIIALGVLVGLSVMLAAGLAYDMKDNSALSVGFFLKLSMSVPLIYAISFCTIQYARERKLEEEYAFKSAISISLDPYQSLVKRIIQEDNAEERSKFTNFILDAIQKVFTSPTEKLFESKDNVKTAALEKALKQVAQIAGSFARAAKP